MNNESGYVSLSARMLGFGRAVWISVGFTGCGQGTPESPRVEQYDHKADIRDANASGSQVGEGVGIGEISAILKNIDGWDAIEVSTWKGQEYVTWRLSPTSSAKVRTLLTREARTFNPSKTPVKFEAKSYVRIGNIELDVFGDSIGGRIGTKEYVWTSAEIAAFAKCLRVTDAKHVQERVQECLDSIGAAETVGKKRG